MENPPRADFELLLRNDFYSFMARCFQHLFPTTKFIAAPYLELVAATLEAVSRGSVTRQIINIPPRYGKSTAASIALVAWHLGRFPEAHIICVSYAQDFAEKLSRDCLSVMNSDWYRRAFPTRLSSSKRTAQEFETTKHGFRLATSVGGVLTGRGADLVIIDDALKPSEAVSDASRNAVNEWYDNSLYSRLNSKNRSGIVIIMQRVHQDDLVGHVHAQEAWKVLKLAAIAEGDEEIPYSNATGRRVFRRRAQEALSPEREPRAVLDSIRKTVGEYNFASQYLQEPAPLEGGLVERKWFNFFTPADLPEKFDRVIQSWDTANKISELSAFSVCTTWGIKGKDIYLRHVLRKRMNYPDLKRAVHEQYKMHSASVILIEDRASGTQLVQELTRDDGLRAVKAVAPDKDKKMRFHAVTGLIENGFVYLPANAPWLEEYILELTTFPSAKFDDQVDSTSQALEWIKTAQREPGHLGAIRAQAAAMKVRDGVPIEEVATECRMTVEEVRRAIEVDKRRNPGWRIW